MYRVVRSFGEFALLESILPTMNTFPGIALNRSALNSAVTYAYGWSGVWQVSCAAELSSD